ncbi:ribosomal protein RPS8 [Cardiosporidium cionae]|uniref:40S ribosomal protein S8 n=1 Tax=Cardiosporidium cionae TaxID=476202 RepID=A0ABQ7J781_9APIC|nr:ribosomal protein RPS8 [Cardiosporidium cionae]|eukprot:KAF8819550.1 ribosomal protein RPS8 [Cardiosporidium cionae]
MGISRDSRHKHRATGGRFPIHKKKRKYELGRPSGVTKLGAKRVRVVRCRGGNLKFRALRLDRGSFSWQSQNYSCKTRVLDVVYNASNNELVRTQTLVKNTIVLVDAAPFRAWYRQHYGVELGRKKTSTTPEPTVETKQSNRVLAKHKSRLSGTQLETKMAEQFNTGRLMACISSRPGQSGRCDGYLLEGDEMLFYRKKLEQKRK